MLLGLLGVDHLTLALVWSLGPTLVQHLGLALILSGGWRTEYWLLEGLSLHES